MTSHFADIHAAVVDLPHPGGLPPRPVADRAVLITGATVLSVDPVIGDLPRGDILLHGDRIAAVGRDLRRLAGSDAQIIDATGTIAIPGFVDSHVHAWEGQLRGMAAAVDFGGYLGLTAFGYGPQYRPHDNYVGTLATALVALDAGITTLVDNSHNALTPDHSRAAVEALLDAGIRGVHAVGAPFGSELADIATLIPALRAQYEGHLMTLRLFDIHPSVELWQYADSEQLWVSSEIGTHTPDVAELFESLHRKGLLTAHHAFNHCYDLPGSVWDLIAESGAAVNMCSRSDAAFGLGSTVSPVADAVRRGIPVGLSNDNEISYGLSMFAEMQNLHSRHRSEVFRRSAAGTPEGELVAAEHLSADALLRFATLGGAANAGLLDVVGSLTPGKQADIVLLDAQAINTFPATDPVTTVTAFADRGNVDTVFVAGELRKRHGQLVGVDLAEVRGLVKRSRDHLLTHLC